MNTVRFTYNIFYWIQKRTNNFRENLFSCWLLCVTGNSQALINTMWLNNTMFFDLRGRNEHVHCTDAMVGISNSKWTPQGTST